MVLAAYLATAFLVGATGAYHLLLADARPHRADHVLHGDVDGGACRSASQIFAGDQHGLNTLEHQPAKVAAMEGHFEAERGRAVDPLRHPRHAGRRDRYAIEVPKLGSLILTHDWNGDLARG